MSTIHSCWTRARRKLARLGAMLAFAGIAASATSPLKADLVADFDAGKAKIVGGPR